MLLRYSYEYESTQTNMPKVLMYLDFSGFLDWNDHIVLAQTL